MGFLIRDLQNCKLQLSALCVFKIPEITSTVEFLSSEQALNNSQNLPGRATSVLEKDFLIDFLLHNKLHFERQNRPFAMPTPTSLPMLTFSYKSSDTEN